MLVLIFILVWMSLAQNFYRENKYHFSSENKFFDSGEFVDYLEQLVANYPIITIEDGMAENDWEGWQELTKRLGNKCQLVGDDLFVTNQAILKEGINNMVANSILIKPNQIGTLTENICCSRPCSCKSLHNYHFAPLR